MATYWTVRGGAAWHGRGQSLVVSRTGRVLARAADDSREEVVWGDVPCGATASEGGRTHDAD